MARPDYLMVDIKSVGDASSPAKGNGWMIVYGIEGTHNDVSSSVLDTPFLIKRGSMLMQVPLDMANQVIRNLPLPTAATQAASKEYVDGSGLLHILKNTASTFIDGHIKDHAECLFSIDRGTKEEVVFDDSSRGISTLLDQTLSGFVATQSTPKFRPKLSTAKNAKRYFMTFDGTQRLITNVDLNPATGTAEIVNAFILFRLSAHNGTHQHFRNSLFGHYLSRWERFVCFATNTNNLIIAGAERDGSEILSGFNIQVTSSDWQSKANASELNKWCCLSVHWDVPAGAGKSSCWVNGKKLKSFQAKSLQGATQMTLGDLIPTGLIGLQGDIQFFLLYEGKAMTDVLIKAHHKMICERYGVDHDAISFP